MRTMKALLVTAAVGAVGIATSMADPVYSANVVGFVNKSLVTGWNIIANPLKGTDNKLSTIIPTASEGTTVYKWDASTQQYQNSSGFTFGSWEIDYVVAPGEGFWVNSPEPQTITFVGEVMTGDVGQTLQPNFNLIASKVPQSGGLTAALQYGPDDGDQVYKWSPALGSWDPTLYQFSFGEWGPSDPPIDVAEGFFLSRAGTGTWNWTRTFNVQ